VALKVIKPGMDTKQVIARFEAERRGSWKSLIRRAKNNAFTQLFNLKDDIGERNDLAKQHPGIVKELTIAFGAW